MKTLIGHVNRHHVCQDLDAIDLCGTYITEATESLNKAILGITSMIEEDDI